MQLSLTAPVESNTVTDQDPFLALKHGEMVADSLAYSLAPRRTRRPGDVRRSFGFAEHRNIFREMNLLYRARGLVNPVLQQSPGIMSCPHRNVLWRTTMYHLNRHLRRSCLPCPQRCSKPSAGASRQRPRNVLINGCPKPSQLWVFDGPLVEKCSEKHNLRIPNNCREVDPSWEYIGQSYNESILDRHTSALGKRQPSSVCGRC